MTDEEKEKPTVPNPGSVDAGIIGCTCPVVANGFGRGTQFGRGFFVYAGDCPIHIPELTGQKRYRDMSNKDLCRIAMSFDLDHDSFVSVCDEIRKRLEGEDINLDPYLGASIGDMCRCLWSKSHSDSQKGNKR